MGTLFLLGIVVINLLMVLTTSRLVFLRVEANIGDIKPHSRCHRCECYGSNNLNYGHACLSLLAGLIYPVTLAVLYVGRKTPTQKHEERVAEIDKIKKELREIEREYKL